MKKLFRAVVALVVFGLASVPMHASATTKTFSFNLDGTQEVPATTSFAAGSAQITIDDVLGLITFYAVAFNLDSDPFAAHIHNGAAGTNGAVVYDLGGNIDSASLVTIGPISVPGSLSFAGVSKAIDIGVAEAINASPSSYYMNIHTNSNPGGEIRGQLAPIPEPSSMLLFGAGLAVFGLMISRRRSAK